MSLALGTVLSFAPSAAETEEDFARRTLSPNLAGSLRLGAVGGLPLVGGLSGNINSVSDLLGDVPFAGGLLQNPLNNAINSLHSVASSIPVADNVLSAVQGVASGIPVAGNVLGTVQGVASGIPVAGNVLSAF
ncbi:hypothetical protein BgiBS90_026223 [Biomphalaria glabrata]|nr:hypothetical protein BgiBS90_026223 [Biomphalaria glabrata]